MLFDRVYRLLIGKKGQTQGIEINNLRIQFSIQKTADKNPNTNNIKIWNLKKDTRAEIEKPDTRCLLYAGYAEDAGPTLIFSGNVTYAWTKLELPDIITTIELGDGTQEIRDTTISVGYGKGVKSNQVLTDVAKKMQIPLTLASNAPERSWNNGLSYHGSARTLLDKVTKATGLEWSIQNGNLQVIEKGMITTRQGIEISQSSGMVGSPESEREAKAQKGKGTGSAGTAGIPGVSETDAEEPSIMTIAASTPSKTKTDKAPTATKKKDESADAKQYWYGWKVKTLLMPMLNPGDRVKLNTKTVEGVFRIEELTHTGDNWTGDWQTELKLVDTAKPIGDKKATEKAKGGEVSRGATLPVPPQKPPTPLNDAWQL
jgi:hypothetical protein